MILIADSGSTKTSWSLIRKNGVAEFYSTHGTNPFFRNTEDIEKELLEKLKSLLNLNIRQICFYGAGIINEDKGNVVKSALQNLFRSAEIEVSSDLLAAARATFGTESGISCILGTGSNSCLFNGKEIIEHIPPLGFILGDEGSGAVLGRKLLGDFLKGIMPENLSLKFTEQFPYDYATLMDKVYKTEKPNQFLAQFVPFLKDNISEKYCQNLVVLSFDEFLQRNVFSYSNFSEHKISFVGSVAFYFQEQLQTVLNKNNLKLGTILKEPLEGLIRFHSK